jgi:hypothetical protein
MALATVITAAVVPQALAAVDRSRTLSAVRYLASRMARARFQAVSRGATIALWFDTVAGDVPFAVYVDGNHNGVLTRDIRSGADAQVQPPVRLGDLFAHVAIALADTGDGSEPVQLSGGTRLLSFTPLGTATAGSVYVRGPDGSQFAIRVVGATARTRIVRYDDRRRSWVDAR